MNKPIYDKLMNMIEDALFGTETEDTKYSAFTDLVHNFKVDTTLYVRGDENDLEFFIGDQCIENRHFSGTLNSREELLCILNCIGVRYEIINDGK